MALGETLVCKLPCTGGGGGGAGWPAVGDHSADDTRRDPGSPPHAFEHADVRELL